jgi:hypothetical protein
MTLAVRIILIISMLIMFTIIGMIWVIAFNTTSLAAALISLPAIALGAIVGLWGARKLLRQQREYQSKIRAAAENQDTTASPPL